MSRISSTWHTAGTYGISDVRHSNNLGTLFFELLRQGRYLVIFHLTALHGDPTKLPEILDPPLEVTNEIGHSLLLLYCEISENGLKLRKHMW